MAKNFKLVRVGLNMSDNDWEHKLKQAQEFVEKNLEVKFQMQIKGRNKYIHGEGTLVTRLTDKLTPYSYNLKVRS